tara:strand:- start:829 stop:2094 length:1266 start_codon:yes stop_codon:yes gene_type:complete
MKTHLERTYNYIAALICISIPFMTYAKAFVNICMICLFVLILISFEKERLIKIINLKFFKAFLIFLIFIILFTLFNDSFINDFAETRKISQTVLLTTLFAFVKDKRFIIYSFILGVFISCVITDYNIISYNLNSLEFLIPKTDVKPLFITQRLYLGIFVVISIVLLSFLLQGSTRNKQRLLYTILLLFFTSTLFLISSRSALLIAFIIFIVTIIYKFKSIYRISIFIFSFTQKLKLIYRAGLLIALLVTLFTIITASKNVSNRLLYSQDASARTFIENIKTHEPRFDIWKFSSQIFKKEKPYLFGIGTFKTQKLLASKYHSMPIEKRRNWFIERNFNTHNQYIDIVLSFGLIGLILFMIFLKEAVSLFYKNIYSLNLILGLMLFLIIENLFHRQLGSFIFALTLVFALHIINSKNEKDISS